MADGRERRVSRAEWKTYYRAVRRRTLENWGEHFWRQVGVSLATTVLGGLLGVALKLGVLSLVTAVSGFALWIVGAAGFYRWRAPVELDRESRLSRDSALADRDVALAELDEARGGGRMPVHVKRVEPFPYVRRNEVLLRILVTNAGRRRATYFVEVIDVQGKTWAGPETPYRASWRGRDHALRAGAHSLIGGGEEMINVAYGAVIGTAGARQRPAEQWVASFSVCAAGQAGEDRHPTPLPDVNNVDDFLQRELVLTYVIVHEESQEPVARTKVRLWYYENGDHLFPDLEIVE